MKIKVCGLRNRADILSVAQNGADFVGFNFYPQSSRYALPSLDPSFCATVGRLFPQTKKTGVFVNASEEEIEAAVALYRLDAVQLHGDESADYCKRFFSQVIVIKAIQVKDEFQMKSLDQYNRCCDFLLLDTASDTRGGSGQKFNWNLLAHYQTDLHFLLAGGISPGDAEEILKINHPKFAGVDINSRFEILPAQKDCAAIAQFIAQIRYENISATH